MQVGGERERERENSWKRRFKKMASPSPAACPGEEEQCRSKTQSFCDSVCFFFLEKRNEFRSNPKMGYDTRSHVNEVNSGPLKLSLFEYIVL
jgi:hypothetical protein